MILPPLDHCCAGVRALSLFYGWLYPAHPRSTANDIGPWVVKSVICAVHGAIIDDDTLRICGKLDVLYDVRCPSLHDVLAINRRIFKQAIEGNQTNEIDHHEDGRVNSFSLSSWHVVRCLLFRRQAQKTQNHRKRKISREAVERMRQYYRHLPGATG
jgi:hypothetical protein